MSADAGPTPFAEDRLDVYLRRWRGGGGGVYGGLLVVIALVLVALPLVRVPVSVQARGLLRGTAGFRVVAAAVDAEVLRVAGWGAGPVMEGDTLAVLSRPDLHLRGRELQQRRARLSEERAWLEAAIRGGSGDETDVTGDRFDPRVEPMTSGSRLRWRVRLSRVEAEEVALQHATLRLAMAEQGLVLTAPVAGTVDWTRRMVPGTRVRAGEALATITPASEVVAEFELSPGAAAALPRGAEVTLRVGEGMMGEVRVLAGRVVERSEPLLRRDAPPVTRLRIRPVMPVVGEGRGSIDELRGSPVTAYFPVGRRSLWSLMIGDRERAGSSPEAGRRVPGDGQG